MRIAVISDIHSNLEALQKALEVISGKNIDEVVCLGDTVGYGANPNECLDLVRSVTPHILLGNHDEAAVDPSIAHSFNSHARTAVAWTAKALTDANKEFIKSLPRKFERHEVLFVHASPFEPDEWHYVLTEDDAENNFSRFSNHICFIGHSHEPLVYCDDGWTEEVVPGKRYIINVGSVGQPRDHDPRLSFGIYDTGTGLYENVRAEYDVKTASDKIRSAGLPAVLAERILVGR
jgi:diadenosine tetraphosphatase ApaH/serine/threonine PP2A family protein phosphatase